MTKEEKAKLTEISLSETLKIGSLLRNYLDTVTIDKEVKSPRTEDQNSALHVYCRERAKTLNDAGLTVQAVLAQAMDIEWNMYRFKELIWKKSLKQITGKKSTTQMTKTGEIDDIHAHIERFLSDKHHMEYMEFPHDPNKQKENLSGVRLAQHANKDKEDYPEYNGAPTL